MMDDEPDLTSRAGALNALLHHERLKPFVRWDENEFVIFDDAVLEIASTIPAHEQRR